VTQQVRSSRPQNADEWRTKKMRSQTIQDNMRKLQNDIVAVQEFCRMRAREIAQKHGKKVSYVERLITSSSAFQPARRVNLRNAIIHRKAKELNLGTSFNSDVDSRY
jgi:peptidoglycan hydrolase CwlO-like protein